MSSRARRSRRARYRRRRLSPMTVHSDTIPPSACHNSQVRCGHLADASADCVVQPSRECRKGTCCADAWAWSGAPRPRGSRGHSPLRTTVRAWLCTGAASVAVGSAVDNRLRSLGGSALSTGPAVTTTQHIHIQSDTLLAFARALPRPARRAARPRIEPPSVERYLACLPHQSLSTVVLHVTTLFDCATHCTARSSCSTCRPHRTRWLARTQLPRCR